ncbi:hypothetical protein NM688_g4715 [Phlebia brevispora]|uniref:Uncharacterized protein n=1 Tax=Phlebia brevispora TaxID=194682 RepID=A0ACC1T1V1_9APHY|nr:hypothetical protein NM688_g4715 [Phlebia brevispora]
MDEPGASSTNAPSTQVHLNYDVLVSLLSHLDSFQDLLSFMSTCRLLRTAGIPYIFETRMEICSDKKLASLCRFLLADNPRRLGFLKQLAVLTYPDSQETVELYLQVLKLAERLEEIEVWCGLPSLDSRIYTTLSNLTTIKTLTIRNLLFREAALLRRMRSPVEKVDISFQYYDQPVDPVWLLHKFAPTLETLRVVLGIQQRDTPTTVYPRLHSLVAESCIFEKIGPLIDAFPNLCDLTIFSYRDEESIDEVAIDRRANQEAQRSRCWSAMERVLGDVLMLYRLGLNCSVRRLEIPWLESTGADRWTPSFHDMFSAVLSDTRPSTLTLILRPAVFDISQFPAFMKAAPESLEKLIVTTYITGDINAESVIVKYYIDCAHVAAYHTPCPSRQWYDSRRGSAPRDPHPTELYLKQASAHQLAQRLLQTSPSLRYFFLELAGQEMSYWQLDGISAQGAPVALSAHAAGQVMGVDRF